MFLCTCFVFFFNDKSPTQDWIFFAWWVNTNTSKPKTCNKKCYSVKKSCLRFSNIGMGWRSWSLWLTERISPLPIRRRTQPMKFVALVKMYKSGEHSVWHLVGALSHTTVAMWALFNTVVSRGSGDFKVNIVKPPNRMQQKLLMPRTVTNDCLRVRLCTFLTNVSSLT